MHGERWILPILKIREPLEEKGISGEIKLTI